MITDHPQPDPNEPDRPDDGYPDGHDAPPWPNALRTLADGFNAIARGLQRALEAGQDAFALAPPPADEQPTPGPWPRVFRLERDHDVSGVSGTGIVAHGALWPDGTVSIRWTGERPSAVHWDRLADAEAVHGHAGATRFVWGGTDSQAVADLEQRHNDLVDELRDTITRVHALADRWSRTPLKRGERIMLDELSAALDAPAFCTCPSNHAGLELCATCPSADQPTED